MDGAYAFTCQLCRARLTLVGSLDAAPGTESAAWAGGRGLLVPQHLQASVFDHTNVDESFIVLDGKRQGPATATPLPQPLPPPHPAQPQPSQLPSQPPPAQSLPLPPHHQQPYPPQRGLDESFVVLGATSLLRPPAGGLHPQHHPPGLSPLHLQALQQQQQQLLLLQAQTAAAAAQPGGPSCAGPGSALGPGTAPPAAATGLTAAQHQQVQQHQQTAVPGGGVSRLSASPAVPSQPPQSRTSQLQGAGQSPGQGQAQPQPQPQPPLPTAAAVPPPPPPHGSSPSPAGLQPSALGGQQRGPGGHGVEGGGAARATADGDGGVGGSVGSGGSGGSGLDSKLQALAQLFELASTNTQVDHPLCMDCVGQLKEEMEAQIAEAEREIAAYSACLAQLEGGRVPAGVEGVGLGFGSDGGQEGGGCRAAEVEEYQLEEISRLEQERDQERARAEVLESELAAVVSELASLSAAAADLDSLEERYWHDVNDFELLLRSHTDERGALLAKIDRAGQRLQLLKNTSVLYDAFKIWHDGPFGTISGFRLGRTSEVPVEWDEINAAWGQAVLLLHTMAQMCKMQFSQYRLLPMGSHPRVADKRSTYDLFGPVYKLWSANYDRAMAAYLACLREFGEHARRKDVQDGKPTPFNFPFAIDGDKVNSHTIKLTLNRDERWTKALKFMLANLKIALQWCVKQDQGQEAPPLQHLEQEGPSEH